MSKAAILKRTGNILAITAILILILFLGLMTIPRIAGYEAFAVLSGSMKPKIPYGSLIFVEKTAFDDIKPDDIVTFESQKDRSKHFTHRIVSVNKKDHTFITKGDNNHANDPVPSGVGMVVGKVCYSMPVVGLPGAFFENKTAVIVTGIFLVLWAAAETEMILSKRKKGKVER